VSITEQASGRGPGGPPPADPKIDSPRRRKRFRWWWLLPPVALLVAAAATILTMLAATYQPIVTGDVSGPNMIPGMPHAHGARWVNQFGAEPGDIYFPPQQGTFTVSASIKNAGTHAVTIESVSLPNTTATLVQAGPVQYALGFREKTVAHVLRNVTLQPGDSIYIGIPVRSGPCGDRSGWTSQDSFLVRERFLSFTHTVSLPFTSDGGSLILHSLSHPGGTDAFCVSQ
jgi:hypothetical protein